MPTSKHRKNRKPYSPDTIGRIGSVIYNDELANRYTSKSKGRVRIILNQNGAPTIYYSPRLKNVKTSTNRKLSDTLRFLQLNKVTMKTSKPYNGKL